MCRYLVYTKNPNDPCRPQYGTEDRYAKAAGAGGCLLSASRHKNRNDIFRGLKSFPGAAASIMTVKRRTTAVAPLFFCPLSDTGRSVRILSSGAERPRILHISGTLRHFISGPRTRFLTIHH